MKLKKRQKKLFSFIVLSGLLVMPLSVYAQETATEETIEEAIESSETSTLSSLPSYTWTDFLINKDCRPLIKELASRPEYNELYQNLRLSCMEAKPLAWDNLLNTFRKEKRSLFFHQTMNATTSYTKYFKVIPNLLFDIQDTQSHGNQPSAILDKTQQAIIDHQLDTALALIGELPDTWKDGLKNTQVLIKQLLRLKEQLEILDKSQQEVQNG